MFKILVCIKQVIDPEAPLSTFRIDPSTRRAIPPRGTPPVISPFDENALEGALKIKENRASQITAISAGWGLAEAVLRKSLAVGTDELIFLEDEAFEELDSYGTALVITSAIRKIGDYDLILCGRQASDTNAGEVGAGLAEMLGLTVATLVKEIVQVKEGQIRVEQILGNGFATVDLALPCVLTISNEIGDLRNSSLKQIVAAAKNPIKTWNSNDLDLDTSLLSPSFAKVKVVKVSMPEYTTKVEIVTGETQEEAGVRLAQRLWEAGAIPNT